MDNVLGSRIKKLREEHGLSQKRLAEELGISNVQLSRYESGDRKPDPEMIRMIAGYFGVMTDYLLGLHDRVYDPEAIYMTAEDRHLLAKLRRFPELRELLCDLADAHERKRTTFLRIWQLIAGVNEKS